MNKEQWRDNYSTALERREVIRKELAYIENVLKKLKARKPAESKRYQSRSKINHRKFCPNFRIMLSDLNQSLIIYLVHVSIRIASRKKSISKFELRVWRIRKSVRSRKSENCGEWPNFSRVVKHRAWIVLLWTIRPGKLNQDGQEHLRKGFVGFWCKSA